MLNTFSTRAYETAGDLMGKQSPLLPMTHLDLGEFNSKFNKAVENSTRCIVISDPIDKSLSDAICKEIAETRFHIRTKIHIVKDTHDLDALSNSASDIFDSSIPSVIVINLLHPSATTTFLNQLFDKPKAKLGERDLENCIVLTVVQEKDLISNYFGNDFISRQIPDERQIDLKSIIQRITLSKGIVLSEEAQLCSEYSQLKRFLENESSDYQVNVNTRLIMLNADSIPNFMEGQLHVLNSQYFINNTIERSPFFRCDGSTVKLGTSEYQIDKNKFAIYFQEEGQPNRSTNTFLTKMKEMGITVFFSTSPIKLPIPSYEHVTIMDHSLSMDSSNGPIFYLDNLSDFDGLLEEHYPMKSAKYLSYFPRFLMSRNKQPVDFYVTDGTLIASAKKAVEENKDITLVINNLPESLSFQLFELMQGRLFLKEFFSSNLKIILRSSAVPTIFSTRIQDFQPTSLEQILFSIVLEKSPKKMIYVTEENKELIRARIMDSISKMKIKLNELCERTSNEKVQKLRELLDHSIDEFKSIKVFEKYFEDGILDDSFRNLFNFFFNFKQDYDQFIPPIYGCLFYKESTIDLAKLKIPTSYSYKGLEQCCLERSILKRSFTMSPKNILELMKDGNPSNFIIIRPTKETLGKIKSAVSQKVRRTFILWGNPEENYEFAKTLDILCNEQSRIIIPSEKALKTIDILHLHMQERRFTKLSLQLLKKFTRSTICEHKDLKIVENLLDLAHKFIFSVDFTDDNGFSKSHVNPFANIEISKALVSKYLAYAECNQLEGASEKVRLCLNLIYHTIAPELSDNQRACYHKYFKLCFSNQKDMILDPNYYNKPSHLNRLITNTQDYKGFKLSPMSRAFIEHCYWVLKSDVKVMGLSAPAGVGKDRAILAFLERNYGEEKVVHLISRLKKGFSETLSAIQRAAMAGKFIVISEINNIPVSVQNMYFNEFFKLATDDARLFFTVNPLDAATSDRFELASGHAFALYSFAQDVSENDFIQRNSEQIKDRKTLQYMWSKHHELLKLSGDHYPTNRQLEHFVSLVKELPYYNNQAIDDVFEKVYAIYILKCKHMPAQDGPSYVQGRKQTELFYHLMFGTKSQVLPSLLTKLAPFGSLFNDDDTLIEDTVNIISNYYLSQIPNEYSAKFLRRTMIELGDYLMRNLIMNGFYFEFIGDSFFRPIEKRFLLENRTDANLLINIEKALNAIRGKPLDFEVILEFFAFFLKLYSGQGLDGQNDVLNFRYSTKVTEISTALYHQLDQFSPTLIMDVVRSHISDLSEFDQEKAETLFNQLPKDPTVFYTTMTMEKICEALGATPLLEISNGYLGRELDVTVVLKNRKHFNKQNLTRLTHFEKSISLTMPHQLPAHLIDSMGQSLVLSIDENGNNVHFEDTEFKEPTFLHNLQRPTIYPFVESLEKLEFITSQNENVAYIALPFLLNFIGLETMAIDTDSIGLKNPYGEVEFQVKQNSIGQIIIEFKTESHVTLSKTFIHFNMHVYDKEIPVPNYFTKNINPSLTKEQKNILERIAEQDSELMGILKAEKKSEIVRLIIEFASKIENKDDDSQKDSTVFEHILTKKVGVCRHVSFIIWSLLVYHNIPAVIIRNGHHSFAAIHFGERGFFIVDTSCKNPPKVSLQMNDYFSTKKHLQKFPSNKTFLRRRAESCIEITKSSICVVLIGGFLGTAIGTAINTFRSNNLQKSTGPTSGETLPPVPTTLSETLPPVPTTLSETLPPVPAPSVDSMTRYSRQPSDSLGVSDKFVNQTLLLDPTAVPIMKSSYNPQFKPPDFSKNLITGNVFLAMIATLAFLCRKSIRKLIIKKKRSTVLRESYGLPIQTRRVKEGLADKKRAEFELVDQRSSSNRESDNEESLEQKSNSTNNSDDEPEYEDNYDYQDLRDEWGTFLAQLKDQINNSEELKDDMDLSKLNQRILSSSDHDIDHDIRQVNQFIYFDMIPDLSSFIKGDDFKALKPHLKFDYLRYLKSKIEHQVVSESIISKVIEICNEYIEDLNIKIESANELTSLVNKPDLFEAANEFVSHVLKLKSLDDLACLSKSIADRKLPLYKKILEKKDLKLETCLDLLAESIHMNLQFKKDLEDLIILLLDKICLTKYNNFSEEQSLLFSQYSADVLAIFKEVSNHSIIDPIQEFYKTRMTERSDSLADLDRYLENENCDYQQIFSLLHSFESKLSAVKEVELSLDIPFGDSKIDLEAFIKGSHNVWKGKSADQTIAKAPIFLFSEDPNNLTDEQIKEILNKSLPFFNKQIPLFFLTPFGLLKINSIKKLHVFLLKLKCKECHVILQNTVISEMLNINYKRAYVELVIERDILNQHVLD